MTVAVINLAKLRLIHGHRKRRRAVVGNDVEHGQQPFGAHAVGELAEVQPRARQVFVLDEEVHAPITMEPALAAVGKEALPGHRVAAAEMFVRVVDDRGDPDRAEAELAHVVGVIEHAAVITTKVTDIVVFAGGAARCRQIKGSTCAALLAMVVRRVAIDEAVGHQEIHGMRRKRFVGPDDLGCLCRRACF